MNFDQLFQKAHGSVQAFPYQRRLATSPDLPETLVAPTGAGKTAALVLGWLYRRRFADPRVRQSTPRRLIFCLPMRTLVRQTADVCQRWLTNLELLDSGTGLERGAGVSVHTVMGGARDEEWHLHPARDAIIIGTQDVLLSGSLNRGYGTSRFAWPWRFALLSNDVLWVFDEVQLMGVGLTTGLQLEASRKSLGTWGPSGSIFSSATLEPDWLRTVDHREPGRVLRLTAEDLAAAPLALRRSAVKKLSRAETAYAKGCDKSLAREVCERHVPGTRTLVVLNTVDGATGLHAAIRKTSADAIETVLLHSRFRPGDRDRNLARALRPDFDGVVVSTQVVEAGIDVSSRTLFTQLAPWSSIVQRAGRCNRQGELPQADVYWLEPEDIEKAPEPYDAADLAVAARALSHLESINPAAIEAAAVPMRLAEPDHVLRRRDVIDLFDTTPDLSGADIDISRFIREGPERDVSVFWRDLSGGTQGQPRPDRDELCSIPFLALRDLLKTRKAHRWLAHEDVWKALKGYEVYPGLLVMLDARDGGYVSDRGFSPASSDPVPEPWATLANAPKEETEEGYDSDPWTTRSKRWITLREHSLDAHQAAKEILEELSFENLPKEAVALAAQVHDIGKSHPVFQRSLQTLGGSADEVWAKSASVLPLRHERRGFRHELASALAWLQAGTSEERALVSYLTAAHHGKVRLSLRALPTERPPDDERLFARGIYDGDEVPETDAGGFIVPSVALSLLPMRLGGAAGGPSWSEMALELRDRFGPFRLAFLEALVRAADVRATQKEERS